MGMASAYMLNSKRERIREAYNTSALGSSSLISNALDMGKWMNFLLFPPDDKKPVIEQMFTTVKLNNGEPNHYAYGIEIKDFNGHKTIGHSGSWSSFTSFMTIVPELGTGIFFANNYRTYTRPIMELYLEVFLPVDRKPEESSKPQTQTKEAEFELETKQLSQFTGLYKLGPTWYLDISVSDKGLFSKATGERSVYMKPLNDSTFRVAAYGNRKITFKTEGGEVIGLEYDGISAPRRSSPFYFNEKEFKDYTGVYFSTELDVLYTVKILNNELIYTNIKTGNYPLFHVKENTFFSEGMLPKIRFETDENGLVSGFSSQNSKDETIFYFQKAK